LTLCKTTRENSTTLNITIPGIGLATNMTRREYRKQLPQDLVVLIYFQSIVKEWKWDIRLPQIIAEEEPSTTTDRWWLYLHHN
jgi:hypothetical protein